MFLNIKTLFFSSVILFSIVSWAQKNSTKANDSIPKDDHYAMFTLGAYHPITFGDNFANDALKQNTGVAFSFLINMAKTPALLGGYFNIYNFEVTNQQLVGGYTEGTTLTAGILAGYDYKFSKRLRLSTVFGLGYAQYFNVSTIDTFKDEGISLSLSPILSYHFTKILGIYIKPEFRRDFMQINTPTELRDYFKAGNYVTLSAGIHILI